jgi:acetylornithine deacetylase/succinyl-diaminopimelate desuccinylase-like protein
MTQTPFNYLAAHRDRTLAELIEFAAIPSVSTDPAHRADIDRAAAWLAAQIAVAGPFDVQIIPTRGHPVVFAQWLGAAGKPTVLVYGHYDVQPPDPLEKWISPPFAPAIRDGRLYARGVSDDKGPLFQAVKAAQAFFATRGSLPVNVKFMFEGEEEIGSPSLEPFIQEHTGLLAADFVISADGGMWRINEPSVTISSRGLAGLEFTLTGAAKDLHSGRHGGAVANPLHAIAELVASLHAPDGRVAVAGFYDDVVELPTDERAAIANLPFDETAYLAEVGATALIGEPAYSTLERQWTRPTLEINGMWGGYQGPGTKTVTPSEAHTKITCRLVPHQDPADITAKIIRHLEMHLPAGVRLAVNPEAHAAQPYRIAPNHVGLRVAEAALAQTFGVQPLVVRMGGTVPVCEVFKRVMGLDTVFFSFSTADEDFHAPNEFFRIHRLYEGLEAWARYWELLAVA